MFVWICSDVDSVLQTEAQAKKGEDVDDEEKIGEEDSQFMKLAKKLTAKTLQKRGVHMHRQQTTFC